MKQYTYSRSYIPMDYNTSKAKGFFGFSNNTIPEPDIDTFLASKDYYKHLNDYGKEGWELISTESITLPIHDTTNKINYQITRGFVLFWKKEISVN